MLYPSICFMCCDLGGDEGVVQHIRTTHSPSLPVRPYNQHPGSWLGGLAAVTLQLFLVCGMGEGHREEGERRMVGGSTVPLAAAGCSPDRFYGHCPRSRPQPPTPRFQLMALPVWVKGQLDSWSFSTHEERVINRHLANDHWWCLSSLCIGFLPLVLNQLIN